MTSSVTAHAALSTSKDNDKEMEQRRDDELMALSAIFSPQEFSVQPRSAWPQTPPATVSGASRASKHANVRQTPSSPCIILTVPGLLSRPYRVIVRTHVLTTTDVGAKDVPTEPHTLDGISRLDSQLGGLQLEGKGTKTAIAAAIPPTAKQTRQRNRNKIEPLPHSQVNRSSATTGKARSNVQTPVPSTGQQHRHDQASYAHQIEETELRDISFLPPIQLVLRLPHAYPDDASPQIEHVIVEHYGLLSFGKLQNDGATSNVYAAAAARAAASRAKIVSWIKAMLLRQWDDMRGEILFWWFEALRETAWTDAECPCYDIAQDCLVFEEFVVRPPKSSSACSTAGVEPQAPSSGRLATMLRTHDMLSKRKEFEGERFGCGICLEEKRGGKCFRLSGCEHVFCQECLSGYLSSMIREGYLRQAVTCPDPECVKDRVGSENEAADDNDGLPSDSEDEHQQTRRGAISEAELVNIVGQSLLDRLHELQDKAQASVDPSTSFCPRPGCQRLVRGDAKDVGTAYESMRQCTCGFTYCLYCSKAWHGKNPCHIVSSTALIEAYQRCALGSTERKAMEIKYGRANLERMVRAHEEEQSNRAWIQANTQSCPCCSVFINKNFGCNHMCCKDCNTHFCYRCATRLNPREPYKHFNTIGTPCYMKLFDADSTGMHGDHEWAEAVPLDDALAWEAENL